MKEYKLSLGSTIFNTLVDGNVEKMMGQFHDQSDGPLIAFYVQVSGNGHRMFIFKNSLVLVLGQNAFKFPYASLEVELEKQSFLKSLFLSSWAIYLKDNSGGPEIKKPVKFSMGREVVMNGVKGSQYDKDTTLAFAPFLENLRDVLPKLPESYGVRFIVTGTYNEKGKIKLKNYRMSFCQELLLIQDNQLTIVNGEVVELPKSAIRKIEELTEKVFLGTVHYVKIDTDNSTHLIASYNQGNPDNNGTKALLQALQGWLKE